MDREFSRYYQLVRGLAEASLSGVRAAASGTQPAGTTPVATEAHSILTTVPPALLLLRDAAEDHEGLVACAQGLAQLASKSSGAAGRTVPRLEDPAGHGRDVYYPLALHVCLSAFARHYESLPARLWGRCEEALGRAVEPARWVGDYTDTPPPPQATALVLWLALCLLDFALAVGRDVDVELADAVVHQVVKRPGPGFSLHPRGESAEDESLDTWTYRELCGLHALADLALLRRNRGWSQRVEQVALHHLQNTQPDHATRQPWAVFAFLWSPRTRVFAEQLIHDATVHGGSGRVGPVGGILLADAAAQLERLAY